MRVEDEKRGSTLDMYMYRCLIKPSIHIDKKKFTGSNRKRKVHLYAIDIDGVGNNAGLPDQKCDFFSIFSFDFRY